MSVRQSRAVCRAVAVFAWALQAALAGPQLTTIEDTLYKADGSKFSGLVIISWKSFEAADTANIAAQTKTVRVVDGYLRVQLAPSTGSVPAFNYAVRYNSDGKIQWEEIWVVPPSSNPLRVRDVRVTNGESTTQAPAPLMESDIVGLAEDLAARPVKGPGYYPNAVAWINSQGQLEGVQGNPSDCVHVDGSSAPCAAAAPAPGTTFVDGETPGGTVDGANLSFTLAAAPDPAASLRLYRNGMLQKLSLDFTLSGSAITFLGAAAPQGGDVLVASYRLNPASGSPQFADAETPGGAIDGSNRDFTLARAPNPATSLEVFRNGMLMKSGTDYTLNGQTIQFQPGSTPQTSDTLLVYYRY
jgi:hypothetical protein